MNKWVCMLCVVLMWSSVAFGGGGRGFLGVVAKRRPFRSGGLFMPVLFDQPSAKRFDVDVTKRDGLDAVSAEDQPYTLLTGLKRSNGQSWGRGRWGGGIGKRLPMYMPQEWEKRYMGYGGVGKRLPMYIPPQWEKRYMGYGGVGKRPGSFGRVISSQVVPWRKASKRAGWFNRKAFYKLGKRDESTRRRHAKILGLDRYVIYPPFE